MEKIILTFLCVFGTMICQGQTFSSALKSNADRGNAESQYQLATCYEKGAGVETDMANAVRYYKLAARQGHEGALFSLGCLMYDGWYDDIGGLTRDCKEGLSNLRMAAKKGNTRAAEIIKYLSSIGYDGFCDVGEPFEYSPIDYSEDVVIQNVDKLTDAAVNKKNPVAAYYLGKFMYEYGDYESAVGYLTISYDAFFPVGGESVTNTGVRLVDPVGMNDYFYYMPSYAGDLLGWCYEKGLGVPVDYQKAIYYYTGGDEVRDAAYPSPGAYVGILRRAICYREMGNHTAFKNLIEDIHAPAGWLMAGDMYMQGRGVAKNYAKAKSLFTKVTEDGGYFGMEPYEDHPGYYADACYRLYQMYRDGYGCAKDPQMASLYFDEALKYGSSSAVYDDQKNYERNSRR